MGIRVASLITFALAACSIDHELVPCGALLCPINFVCTPGGCATPEAASACIGLVDGDPCANATIIAGTCSGGSCHPVGCGNGIVDLQEACDDGNEIYGDGCAADCRSDETCGNDVTDVVSGEECDRGMFGLSADGCTSRCTFEVQLWRDATPINISARSSAAVAFDRNRNVLVLFGGYDGMNYLTDTWEWNGRQWLRRHSLVSPPPRTGHAMAYHPASKRVVLFGGRTPIGQPVGDTWEWDGVTWLERSPATSPAARSSTSMALDQTSGRIVIFGGLPAHADTWAWDGATWSLLAATSPAGARFDALMTFDPSSQRLLLFGGSVSTSGPRNDTWLWTGTTWQLQNTNNTQPSLRNGASLVGDVANNRVVYYGGSSGLTTYADLWVWNNSSGWAQLTITGTPAERTRHSMAYDPIAMRVLVFGGARVNDRYADTFELVGSNWRLLPEIAIPSRLDYGLAYDAGRGRIVAFGGRNGFFARRSDTWEWDGENWIERTATGAIAARFGHAMVYDEARRTVVAFGGDSAALGHSDDLWQWNGSTWTQSIVTTRPLRRMWHAMAYDRARQRIVMFGGNGLLQGEQRLDDTWEWDGAAWTELTPAVHPSRREDHAMAYDAARGKVVLFGGAIVGGTPSNELWEWDGTTWENRTMPGPQARTRPALAYDSRRRVIVLFGGADETSASFGDTWEWDGVEWRKHLPAATPRQRSDSSLAYDGIRGRLLVFSGIDGANTLPADTWLREFESASVLPERCAIATDDSDEDGLIGCADPDCFGRCSPLCHPGETCAPGLPRCGDGACSLVEDYLICPNDCPAP